MATIKAAAPAKEPRVRVKKNAIIRILVIGNPKRKGTKAAVRFDLYKNGMTVGEYIAAGGKSADVLFDANAKHIIVTDAPETK